MEKLLKHNCQRNEFLVMLLAIALALPTISALSVTINHPDNEYVMTLFPVEFTIDDSQATSWLIDINYSNSPTQGTGVTLINDENFDLNNKTPFDWNAENVYSYYYEFDAGEAIDFDRDGDIDILQFEREGSLYFHENDGFGNFTYSQICSGSNWDLSNEVAAIADFDGDNDYDMVLPVKYYDAGTHYYQLRLLRNDGSMDFTEEIIYESGTSESTDAIFYLGAGDLDGDNDIDIAFVKGEYSNASFYWGENDGNANFTIHLIYPDVYIYQGYFPKLIIADFNGDGTNDIIGPTKDYSSRRALWLNNGDGTFTYGYENIRGYYGVDIGDLDNDGDLDIITSSYVYLNDGSGNFTAQSLPSMPYYISDGHLYDLDNDGDLDFAGIDDEYLFWLENDGSGSFMPHTIARNVSGYYDDDPLTLFARDFDNDDDVDIIVKSEYNPNTLVMYEHIPLCEEVAQNTYRCYKNIDFSQIPNDRNYYLLLSVYNGSNISFTYSYFENDSHSPFIHCPSGTIYIKEDAVFSPLTCNVADSKDEGILKIISNNVTIDCNGMRLIGDDTGVAIDNNQYDNITIKNCHIQDYYYGVYFYANNETINHVIVQDNNFVSNRRYGLYGAGEYTSNYGYDYNIIGNIFQENYTHGAYLKLHHSSIVRNNVFSGSTSYGLYFYIWGYQVSSSQELIEDNNFFQNYAGLYAYRQYGNEDSYIEIKNNRIYDNNVYTSSYGAYLSSRVHFHNNTVYNNRRGGIRTRYGLRYIVIEDNNIFGNNNYFGTSRDYSGVLLYYPRDNVIVRDNNISDNTYGIYVYRRSSSHDNNVIIKNNTIEGNLLNGIKLDNTYDVNIVANAIWDNGSYSSDYGGVKIDNSYQILLKDNNISQNNGFGIYLSGSNSQNNLIYNNYFFNTINAIDASGNAQDWNVGKREGTNIVGGPYLGGNYWSDYSGTDTDGDYIGDTMLPYNADGNIQTGGDYLPLLLAPAQPTITAIINSPNGGESLSGTVTIDFNVSCSSCTELHVKLAYSSSSGLFENIIASDLNLNDYANISGLSCDGTDWSSSTNCTYSWDTTQATNGTYYIDLNLWDESSNHTTDSSDSAFTINNTVTYSWTHVAITYSTTNGLKLYVNGQLADTNTAAGTIPTNDENIIIAQNYSGLMEELKLFADELNANEVASDYNAWMNAYFISPVFDANSSVTWTNLSWNQSVAPQYNRIRVQVRACSDSSCSSSNFTGPNGTGSYYTDSDGSSLNLAGRYFQFKAFLDTNSVTQLPILHSVTVDYNKYASVGYFTTQNITIIDKNRWSSVELDADQPAGTGIYFQVSTDNGNSWLYWNGSAWVETTDNYNDLETLNAHISSITSDSLKLKIKLTGNGDATPIIRSVVIKYIVKEQ